MNALLRVSIFVQFASLLIIVIVFLLRQHSLLLVERRTNRSLHVLLDQHLAASDARTPIRSSLVFAAKGRWLSAWPVVVLVPVHSVDTDLASAVHFVSQSHRLLQFATGQKVRVMTGRLFRL